MITTENIGWIALVLVLVVAVSAVIIQPIYDKAVEAKDEIDDFDFEAPTESGSIDLDLEYAVILGTESNSYIS